MTKFGSHSSLRDGSWISTTTTLVNRIYCAHKDPPTILIQRPLICGYRLLCSLELDVQRIPAPEMSLRSSSFIICESTAIQGSGSSVNILSANPFCTGIQMTCTRFQADSLFSRSIHSGTNRDLISKDVAFIATCLLLSIAKCWLRQLRWKFVSTNRLIAKTYAWNILGKHPMCKFSARPTSVPSDVFDTSVYYWWMLSLSSRLSGELFQSALPPGVTLKFFVLFTLLVMPYLGRRASVFSSSLFT